MTEPIQAAGRPADKALVEIEQAHSRFRVALRYSETDADFLWLSRAQAAAVASQLCALIPGLPAASVALAVLDAAAPYLGRT